MAERRDTVPRIRRSVAGGGAVVDTADPMRRLLTRSRHEAPFLYSERGTLSLTAALQGTGGRGSALVDGPEQRGLTLRGEQPALDRAGVRFEDVDAAGCVARGWNAADGRWTRCRLQRATLEGLDAPCSHWEVVDGTGLTARGGSVAGGHFALVSLRDADLSELDASGATFILCDFSGARLSGVDLRGARFVGCDFEGAHLDGCPLDGADLGGAGLRRSAFRGCSLEGVEWSGADLRGVAGLSAAELTAVRAGGGRAAPGRLYQLWSRVLGGSASPASHRRILNAVGATWGLLGFALPILFFVRAIVAPIDPNMQPGLNQSYEDEQPQDEQPQDGQPQDEQPQDEQPQDE